ncbi:MAG: hypothetical protein IJ046_04505 [Clostridia bacterium]|nr:hypothetical protein [Clostridia bacterium]
MKCENVFCIYQSKGECTVEEMGVDASGMCNACIYPDADDMELESAKARLLERLEKRE